MERVEIRQIEHGRDTVVAISVALHPHMTGDCSRPKIQLDDQVLEPPVYLACGKAEALREHIHFLVDELFDSFHAQAHDVAEIKSRPYIHRP